MGEHLIAESENCNDGIRYDEGSGGLAAQDRAFRRRVDMEEMCENAPWILCPHGGEDDNETRGARA